MASDISLGNPNPTTGAFNFVIGDDGDVQFDDTGAHAVMTSVIERFASYAFDQTHGSNIWQIRSLTTKTPSQVEAETLSATKSLVDVGEIQNLVADASNDPSTGSRLDLDVSWNSGTDELQTQTTQV